MPDYSKHINVDLDITPFQTVIFGKDAPLLEVELNEMQMLQYHRSFLLMRDIIGNVCSEEDCVTKTESGIMLNGTFVVNGYIFVCDHLEVEVPNGSSLYINTIMGVADRKSTLRKHGYADGEIIQNTIIDPRLNAETTRRNYLELSLAVDDESGGTLIASLDENGILTRHLSIGASGSIVKLLEKVELTALGFENKDISKDEETGETTEQFVDGRKIVTTVSDNVTTQKYYSENNILMYTHTVTKNEDGSITERTVAG